VSAQGGPTRVATFAVNDDLSAVYGNHQIAFGGSAAAWWVNSYSGAYYMNFSFNGQTYGLGLADFLMGEASSFTNGTNVEQHNRSKYAGLYGGDTWKINQKLTLNYGLRWEPYFPQINLDGSSIHYDEAGLRKGIKTNRFINAPPGLYFDGDPGFPDGQGMHNKC
jgi:outer membrane receptor protein involved in Fe transport